MILHTSLVLMLISFRYTPTVPVVDRGNQEYRHYNA